MEILFHALFAVLLVFQQVSGCRPAGEPDTVQIGKQTYVCLVFNDREINVLTPIADQYSRIMIPDSFAKATNIDPFFFPKCNAAGGTPSLFYAESMGVKSIYQKMYAACPPSEPDSSYFFPLQTIIISVEMGVVQSVTWDDGCFSCSSSSSECQPNSFGLRSNEPVTPNSEQDGTDGRDCGVLSQDCQGYDCDLTVYIVWRGRDINGNYFGSAGSRVSRFALWSADSLSAFNT